MKPPLSLPLSPVDLQLAFATAAAWLERHRDAINALNVYPVPDGDTGLNMSLTLRSAADRAAGVAPASVGAVAAAAARGALMGARGNSGVILAQILRGISSDLGDATSLDAHRLASALVAGADAAYAAVPAPVEGTILTVARSAAAAARAAADDGQDVLGVLRQAQDAARLAVAATPSMLPILHQAGVVDAGGEGFRVILEGVLKHVLQEPIDQSPITVVDRADLTTLHAHADEFGYCTEVLFQAIDVDHSMVRERLQRIGTSLLVIGDDTMLKIHVHTERPGAALDLATELGQIVSVKVDNMGLQHRSFWADAATSVPPEPGTCVVAVVQGEGFRDLFASLGSELVDGGDTMNPSVEAIAIAIRHAPRSGVVVLPNHRNVVLAAEQAVRLVTDRKASVLPTTTLPQGIAAVLALNPAADPEENREAIERAARNCHSIEMTRAVRDLTTDEVTIQIGEPFAFVDGRVAATASTYSGLVEAALALLPDASFEVATLYLGASGKADEAAGIAKVIQRRLGLAAETLHGGGASYEYIVSIE